LNSSIIKVISKRSSSSPESNNSLLNADISRIFVAIVSPKSPLLSFLDNYQLYCEHRSVLKLLSFDASLRFTPLLDKLRQLPNIIINGYRQNTLSIINPLVADTEINLTDFSSVVLNQY